MATDIFLKIGDIKGESLDDKHKDEIDVMSFSWGLSQTGTLASGGGAGTGKAQFQDLHFTSNMSKASPKLFLACASGEHIKEATLSGRRGGDGKAQGDYLILKMTDVLISSYQTGGANGSNPTDQVSMAYAKIEFTYKPQNSDGSLDAGITTGWDLKANKKV
ncbi:MAG: type VI secretion system tube protein Hcp [Chloroflexota bacterium]|nr:type VI secretion system tube protein Hcp [Chloroflexota bacterium]